jgi:hypothetical protein
MSDTTNRPALNRRALLHRALAGAAGAAIAVPAAADPFSLARPDGGDARAVGLYREWVEIMRQRDILQDEPDEVTNPLSDRQTDCWPAAQRRQGVPRLSRTPRPGYP